MKEKDYNLEIIRNISFLSVIIIHVANYYCRAFDKIPQNEYIFSLILDTLARVSVPCFFMISGALLLGRDEPLKKTLASSYKISHSFYRMEHNLLFLEYLLFKRTSVI